ncbi:outer membrane protein assembly factor BamA [Sphingosinicella sp. BN140058]|uniref:outer membrane protein assembly factor BamA n=1 Tax=Sphingosinicella sp. BN140058 TaxID=1892855 RepID=UPI001011E066|nr:outer membrane protein assembly factor BamA [Sphingosinicella sp. BN140058]QAY78221.1 outer membrane protein assembly factor BamA [Sphingosinicella sp. BN140058]
MTSTNIRTIRRVSAALLIGSTLVAPAGAQDTPPPSGSTPKVSPQFADGKILSLAVNGAQRLESETVISYVKLRVGEAYTRERLDDALRDLYATELFADVQIRDDHGALTVQVSENPVINRILLEGNKRIKDEKLRPEIRLQPRQIFTRSKARADVARIIELYRRQGRFAAEVEPKMVQLDQNRVDLIFEIREGVKSKVRQINILGNTHFSDGEIRAQMATKRTGPLSFLGSGAVYDPDRLAYDQQKLRQFYLMQGFADFRVVSAIAELTPDKTDFIITYVVEEGERYRFGEVKVDSEIRDLPSERLRPMLPMKQGDWYNAKQIEDTVTAMNAAAGTFGYAFADVSPQFQRDKDKKTMSVTFRASETPRVYVERVDINGNRLTEDKVIRREFRLAEGDAFSSVRIKRSQDRINSLGFFQENLEIRQEQGSSPDRVNLAVDVEEKATGELQVSAGYSSLESFLVNLSITQRNFRGKGQIARASVAYSAYSKSVELGFTEPYLFDRNIALGVDIFRRDYNSFNYIGDDRNTTYSQVTTGGQIRLGVPLTEYSSLALRYGLSQDEISLDKATYFTDRDGNGVATCDPLIAGRYLCSELGSRLTSSVGYSLAYNNLNNSIRPIEGERLTFSQDFAGLGGDVRYIRSRLEGAKYWGLGDSGFVLQASAESGYIHPLDKKGEDGSDAVRITDRFFLGEPQLRGFDIRGIGPRIRRVPYESDGTLSTDKSSWSEDALGGRAYYKGSLELDIPVPGGLREMGLRPSLFVDAGAVFGVDTPDLLDLPPGSAALTRATLTSDGLRQCTDSTSGAVSTIAAGASGCPDGSTLVATSISPFKELYYGNSAKPRLSVGFGINWNSPMGPFRIDIAKALLKQKGDGTKLITINVGTAF